MAKGKKYKSVVMGEHILQNVKQLLSSTIFSICLTTGLHFYKGMITGMAIQIVMGPFNLFENPLFRLFVLGYKPDSRVFDEKNSKDELEADDVIVDEDGKTIYPSSGHCINTIYFTANNHGTIYSRDCLLANSHQ